MKIMGHRGARHEAPENTLRSIQCALDAGVEAVEIDVHLSSDGHLVVIHDETLDRTTNGAGPVGALDLAALQALDAGEGEKIPSLSEVLELVRGRAEVFVELKAPGCELALVETLRAHDQVGEAYVKSFVHPWLLRIKDFEPQLRTACLIYGRPVDPVGLLSAAQAQVLSLGIALVDADLVGQCHAAGLEVCVWNCNEPEKVASYAEIGVDWLGTDVPTAVCAQR